MDCMNVLREIATVLECTEDVHQPLLCIFSKEQDASPRFEDDVPHRSGQRRQVITHINSYFMFTLLLVLLCGRRCFVLKILSDFPVADDGGGVDLPLAFSWSIQHQTTACT